MSYVSQIRQHWKSIRGTLLDLSDLVELDEELMYYVIEHNVVSLSTLELLDSQSEEGINWSKIPYHSLDDLDDEAVLADLICDDNTSIEEVPKVSAKEETSEEEDDAMEDIIEVYGNIGNNELELDEDEELSEQEFSEEAITPDNIENINLTTLKEFISEWDGNEQDPVEILTERWELDNGGLTVDIGVWTDLEIASRWRECLKSDSSIERCNMLVVKTHMVRGMTDEICTQLMDNFFSIGETCAGGMKMLMHLDNNMSDIMWLMKLGANPTLLDHGCNFMVRIINRQERPWSSSPKGNGNELVRYTGFGQADREYAYGRYEIVQALLEQRPDLLDSESVKKVMRSSFINDNELCQLLTLFVRYNFALVEEYSYYVSSNKYITQDMMGKMFGNESD